MLGLRKGAREGDGKDDDEKEGDQQPKRQGSALSTNSKRGGGKGPSINIARLGGKDKGGSRVGSSSSRRLGALSTKKEKDFNFGKEEYDKWLAARSQVLFDADFESANIEQVRLREKGVYDIWIRNDSNG